MTLCDTICPYSLQIPVANTVLSTFTSVPTLEVTEDGKSNESFYPKFLTSEPLIQLETQVAYSLISQEITDAIGPLLQKTCAFTIFDLSHGTPAQQCRWCFELHAPGVKGTHFLLSTPSCFHS